MGGLEVVRSVGVSRWEDSQPNGSEMIVPDTVSLATLTLQKLMLIVLCLRSVHVVDQQLEDFRSSLWRAWCLMF